MKILQGIDLVKVERMERMIERPSGRAFLARVFSAAEQAYCGSKRMKYEHYAARFAAKEAIVKALGTGFGAQVTWHDIEVLNDDLGKPVVLLTDALMKRFDHPRILVSISHSDDYATAVAIWS